MKKAVSYIMCAASLLFVACEQQKSVNAKQLVKYVEDRANGFRKDVEVEQLVYTFQFKPVEFIVSKEMHGDISDSVAFNNRRKKMEGTIWFNIGLKGKGTNVNPLKMDVSGLEEYNERLSYFLVEAQRNFKLLYGNEEMQQVDYYFENNYGLTPMDVMIIGYKIPGKVPQKEIQLAYTDGLFNNGIVKATIAAEDLRKYQNLTLSYN